MVGTSCITVLQALYYVAATQSQCYHFFSFGDAADVSAFLLLRLASHYPVLCLTLRIFWVPASFAIPKNESRLLDSVEQELNSTEYIYFYSASSLM